MSALCFIGLLLGAEAVYVEVEADANLAELSARQDRQSGYSALNLTDEQHAKLEELRENLTVSVEGVVPVLFRGELAAALGLDNLEVDSGASADEVVGASFAEEGLSGKMIPIPGVSALYGAVTNLFKPGETEADKLREEFKNCAPIAESLKKEKITEDTRFGVPKQQHVSSMKLLQIGGRAPAVKTQLLHDLRDMRVFDREYAKMQEEIRFGDVLVTMRNETTGAVEDRELAFNAYKHGEEQEEMNYFGAKMKVHFPIREITAGPKDEPLVIQADLLEIKGKSPRELGISLMSPAEADSFKNLEERKKQLGKKLQFRAYVMQVGPLKYGEKHVPVWVYFPDKPGHKIFQIHVNPVPSTFKLIGRPFFFRWARPEEVPDHQSDQSDSDQS